jgi:hypothetical protein
MDDGEVGLSLIALGRLRLLEVWMLAQVVVVQLLHEAHVGCLGRNALFVQHGDAQRLLVTAGSRCQTNSIIPFVLKNSFIRYMLLKFLVVIHRN